MKSFDEIIKSAKRTLETESYCLHQLCDYVDHDFASAVAIILKSKGRVIITGIGKSALIAGKIVATLNSTGTPAVFMHAADAIHGDLGTIQKDDVVICISKSGNTPEVKVLIPLIKQFGNPVIAMTGDSESYLAKQADYRINTYVEKEACPNNLAPTSSTTAQLAMGDALAVCLLESRGFTEQDFAKYHPGGSLGKKLYLRISDLFIHNATPRVSATDDVRKVIVEISAKRLGAVAVLNDDELVGVITDGDIRRMLEQNTDINGLNASDIMNTDPKFIEADELAVEAVSVFKTFQISQLLVKRNGKYAGFVHFHDLLREGII